MSAAHGSRAGRHGEHPSLITSAQPGTSAEFNSRQVRYLITMGFRVACFISMIWVPNPWRWLLFAAAVILPAVAVMFANQADQRTNRGKFDTATGPRFSVMGSTLGELPPTEPEGPHSDKGQGDKTRGDETRGDETQGDDPRSAQGHHRAGHRGRT